MMASYRVAILACAAWGAIACSAVRADFLQATANATSVSVSLTVGSGAFPQINSLSFQAGAQVAIGPQSLGPFTSTTSVGPLQLSDTLTESTAQSYGAVTTAVINGNKTFNISTSSYGSASSAFSAFANGFGGTGNLSHAMNIGPFAQPTPAVFDINLIGDYGANPSAAYSVQGAAAGNVNASHFSQVETNTSVDSNLPGLGTIADLQSIETWESGIELFQFSFSSQFISQPIFASDFLAGPNGSYSLDPSKRDIQIPVTIPAGIVFEYAVGTGTNVQITPEPSTLALAALGFAALVAWRSRRR